VVVTILKTFVMNEMIQCQNIVIRIVRIMRTAGDDDPDNLVAVMIMMGSSES